MDHEGGHILNVAGQIINAQQVANRNLMGSPHQLVLRAADKSLMGEVGRASVPK